MEFGAYQGRQCSQGLAVQVVYRRREHEDAQHYPAGAVCIHWNSMVATSPLVASLALGLGKYSTFTRVSFCAPQLSRSWPPPIRATWAGSTTSNFTVIRSWFSTTKRRRLPRQSTCFSTPVATPDGCGPSHHGTTFSSLAAGAWP